MGITEEKIESLIASMTASANNRRVSGDNNGACIINDWADEIKRRFLVDPYEEACETYAGWLLNEMSNPHDEVLWLLSNLKDSAKEDILDFHVEYKHKNK